MNKINKTIIKPNEIDKVNKQITKIKEILNNKASKSTSNKRAERSKRMQRPM